MPYLIDGHNLIPKVKGLSLDEVDDEMGLVEMLQEFCQQQRKQAEVFFDNAAPGGVKVRKFGRVLARFVYRGITADQAISTRLGRLGGEARNWTVVSSDRGVQAAARGVHAQVMPSEAFAALLEKTLDESKKDLGAVAETEVEPEDVDEWLRLFGGKEEGGAS